MTGNKVLTLDEAIIAMRKSAENDRQAAASRAMDSIYRTMAINHDNIADWLEELRFRQQMVDGGKWVLFSSARPLGRCENITAVYNAYRGAKRFVTHSEFARDTALQNSGYSIMVDDDFGAHSKAPVIMISHGVITKTYGLTQPNGYFKAEDANRMLCAVSSSDDPMVIDITAQEYGIPKSKIMPLGMPRFDQMFGKKKGDGDTSFVHEFRNKRVYLYCPTFRSWSKHQPPKMELFDIDNLLRDDEIFAIKMHMVTGRFSMSRYKHIVQLNPDEPTIPYLIDCDCLVTDFSSIMFDAHFLKKTVVLFAKDTDRYLSERGMCMDYPTDYSSMYCENECDLVDKMRYGKRNGWDEVIRIRMTGSCDGQSAQKIAELIYSEINKGEKRESFT